MNRSSPVTCSSPGDLRGPRADAVMPIIVADLDGTIIHSARRCPAGRRLVVVETYEDRDVGFMTDAGWSALATLQSIASFVPATARTERQYARLRFPSPPPIAVVEAGAVVLVDGTACGAWAQQVAKALDATGTTQSAVARRMRCLHLAEEARTGDHALVYARLATGHGVESFGRWCADRNWRIVRQDGRLYALPEGIDKSLAVDWVVQNSGGAVVAAAGDGLMDLRLLASAPLAITPAGGPLWNSGWRAGISVVGYGPDSAEQILVHAIEAAITHSLSHYSQRRHS